jgi:hypothetical protein
MCSTSSDAGTENSASSAAKLTEEPWRRKSARYLSEVFMTPDHFAARMPSRAARHKALAEFGLAEFSVAEEQRGCAARGKNVSHEWDERST